MKKEILSVGLALVLGGTVVPAWALFESDRALSEKASVSMVEPPRPQETPDRTTLSTATRHGQGPNGHIGVFVPRLASRSWFCPASRPDGQRDHRCQPR